jgi:hypothetical protein
MIYGMLLGLCTVLPIAYVMVENVKNTKRIKELNNQMIVMRDKVNANSGEITYLKNHGKAEICYNILKDQCKRMGTCNMFK